MTLWARGPVGKSGLDWTRLFFRGVIFFGGEGGGVVLLFSSLKKNRVSNLSPTGYIFSLGAGGEGRTLLFF